MKKLSEFFVDDEDDGVGRDESNEVRLQTGIEANYSIPVVDVLHDVGQMGLLLASEIEHHCPHYHHGVGASCRNN